MLNCSVLPLRLIAWLAAGVPGVVACGQPLGASFGQGGDAPLGNAAHAVQPTPELVVMGPSGSYVASMSLTAIAVRSPGFALLVDRGAGPVAEPAPWSRLVRGDVIRGPLAGARLFAVSRGEGEAVTLSGAMIDAANNAWLIEPELIAGVWTSVARPAPFDINGLCGVGPEHERHQEPADPADDADVAEVTLRQIELSVDADSAYFASRGSSTDALTDHVESIIALLDDIYTRDVGARVVLKTLVIRADPATDPYSDTSLGLLDQTAAQWNGPLAFYRGDLGHLFTGRSLGGGVIGVAWVGTGCSTLRYGVSNMTFSSSLTSLAAVVAHEMGHNLAAGHCDGNPQGCHIMCSGLGGCDGLQGPKFGPASIATISGYIAPRSCFASVSGDIVPVPVTDTFVAAGTPNDALWAATASVVVDPEVLGQQAVSQPFALSVAPGQAAPTEFLDTVSPPSELALRLWVRPEAGSTSPLLIETQGAGARSWSSWQTIAPARVPAQRYERLSLRIPAGAAQREYAFQLRALTGAGTGDWLVDDFAIEPASPISGSAIMLRFEEQLSDLADIWVCDGCQRVTPTTSPLGSWALRLQPGQTLETQRVLADSFLGVGSQRLRGQATLTAQVVNASAVGSVRLQLKDPIRNRALDVAVIDAASAIAGPVTVTVELPADIPATFRLVVAATAELGGAAWDVDDVELVREPVAIEPDPCVPDFTGDGELDIFDIFAFFAAFGAGGATADLAPDGSLNIFDILAFFAQFGAGCR